MVQIRELDDPRLVKALAHPMRITILRLLQSRVASPSELAEEMSARLTNVSYHFRVLERMGLIELVKTRPRRGAVEHYYKARARLRITDQVWGQVPDVVKSAMADAAVLQAVNSISAAAAANGFSRKEAIAARAALSLDEQGFREVSAAAQEMYHHAAEIEKQSLRRMGKHRTGEIKTGFVVSLFEAAPVETSDVAEHRRTRRRAKA